MTTIEQHRPPASDQTGPIQYTARPRTGGKFLLRGDDKLYVRGVTYGTFAPGVHGEPYSDPPTVANDFATMAAEGCNAVRVYTVPPRWLLDLAAEHGLVVMIGLPWEQHVAFLDDRRRRQAIEASVRAAVRACAGHPAVLCYAIGNEIPASIVRWYGRRRVERFLRRLFDIAKREDPDALVTYVNYPTTEYLDLPFLDLVCFNVYLERREQLADYMARLQNLAGDRPLLMAEIGLDSRSHGLEAQAAGLDWQARTAFAEGAAGAFVFAWTDEWHRGGHDIADWDFGLTDRERRPKPALSAVRAAWADAPFGAAPPAGCDRWPSVSVVVCSYNGARTIEDCMAALRRLDYPDYEVIVVDDGSRDATAEIARSYGYRVISTENRGLSSARNTGMEAARGEIVAYTDDDAYPDPHWLRYLAATYAAHPEFVAVGGPNIAPPGDGRIADCIANAPGGPVHVLLDDREAEHIPGCNMSFRRDALRAIGGFDVRYRTAGDDVDVCWRLQERGGRIGFAAGAMVWHHRRNSLRMYWRQQRGYGRAEALLEAKWPEKYNGWGHLAWGGRLYGKGLARALAGRRGRIYQGSGGSAPFQSLYQPAPGLLSGLVLMPEWYLLLLALATLSIAGAWWSPLLAAVPLLAAGVLALGSLGVRGATGASFTTPGLAWPRRLAMHALTGMLHLAQPMARLRGRLSHGLTPWRRRAHGFRAPRPRTATAWRERWTAPSEWLAEIERSARAREGVAVRGGGGFDRWDLEVAAGGLGGARLLLAIEEHGAGRQLARFRWWPTWSRGWLLCALALVALAVTAGAGGAPAAVVAGLAIAAGLIAVTAAIQAGAAVATLERALPPEVDA